MEFEWDEGKRAATLQKHGIDFEDAAHLWRGPHIDPARQSVRAGEQRTTAIGMADIAGHGTAIVAVIYTVRDYRIRIITARPATRHERAAYRAAFG